MRETPDLVHEALVSGEPLAHAFRGAGARDWSNAARFQRLAENHRRPAMRFRTVAISFGNTPQGFGVI